MEQLLDLKDNLIITEQVYREFLRNRNGLINDLINKLKGFEVKEDYYSIDHIVALNYD